MNLHTISNNLYQFMGFRFVQYYKNLMHDVLVVCLLFDFSNIASGFKPAVYNNMRPAR